MDEVEMFEKKGQVIYGIARIDHLLTELDAWFIGHRRSQSEQPFETPDSKFEIRRNAARVYFSRNGASEDTIAAFFEVLALFRDLEQDCERLGLENPALVSSMLIRTKELHLSAAEILENIGYKGFPASKLRQRAEEIQTPR